MASGRGPGHRHQPRPAEGSQPPEPPGPRRIGGKQRAVVHRIAVPLVCVLATVHPDSGASVAQSRGQAVGEAPRGVEAGSVAIDAQHARGLELYARRAEGSRGATPAAEPIGQAVQLLAAALERRPGDVALRADLLRALLFQAEYVATTADAKKQLFERGRRIFVDGLERLERESGERRLLELPSEDLRRTLADEPAAGRLVFWGAVHYGLWGEYYGTLAAVRRGLAKKLRIYGEAARALDPELDGYGPSRFLGRLHHLTPRVPLVTGWADRDEAVRLLREAATKASEDPLNRLFYAEALWDLRGEHRLALEQLALAARLTPRPDHRIEDARALERVAELERRIRDDLQR